MTAKNRNTGARSAPPKATASASAAASAPATATATAPKVESTPVDSNKVAGAGAAMGDEPKVLFGSSTLASLIEIGGQEVPLGTVVAAAHAASGLSGAAWNALPEEERDVLLNAQVAAMRECAADEARARDQQEQAEREAARRKEADAQEREQARQAQERAAEAQAVKFPCVITVSNNSGIALVEPYSGAFISAGGTAPITLNSPGHAHNVLQNLRAVLEANYIPYDKLVIEGLPK